MNTQEVKGTLAKLLATENLTVEHRKVSTACFDVEKRVLILPIWKNSSDTVYDLLVGHEVGHALYTPNADVPGVSKAFLNVLEDARIERMMKRTYPGLRKSFYEGYKELWDRDFFGVKDEDPENLSLIDRINLYFKGNPNTPFSEDEQVWVNRATYTQTFDDVIELARELWDYANQKQEEKELELPPTPQNQSGSQSSDTIEVTPNEDMTHEEMLEEAERREQENDTADLDTPSYDHEHMDDIGGKDETESITDAALQEALETLVDDDAKEWVYLSLPDIDVDKYIVPFDLIQNNLYNHFYKTEGDSSDQIEYRMKNIEYGIDHYTSFKKDTQKTVNYLCKQFEMKKSADEYRRAATARTGVLDTNKLHTYKYNDDIFKKVTVIPEGKNHGLVMFLDWSGSMQHQLLDTLKQTYNLIWFCKKSGIPFRVYGFQSGYRTNLTDDLSKDNDLCISGEFRLLEFFSSRQNARSLEKSMQMVYLQAFAMGGYRISHCSEYTLGGTPLGEAVMCARSIVNKIKRVEKVTKVNVICLTDGEANPLSFVSTYTNHRTGEEHQSASYLCHQKHKVFILRDPVTGYSRRIHTSPYHTTREIVSFMREVTDYNWIGIRICTKGEASRVIREYADFDEFVAADRQWKKERFASVKGKVGYTEAFFIPSQNMSAASKDIEVKQKKEVATKAELARAFKKHMGSKMANKTILNAFIEQIA